MHHTFSHTHTHTPTQYSYVCLPLHRAESTTTGKSVFRKQPASEAYCLHAEKREMLKDRKNNTRHGKLTYKKQVLSRLVWVAPLLSRRVLGAVFVEQTSE